MRRPLLEKFMIKFNKKCVWSFPRERAPKTFEQDMIETLDDKAEQDIIKAGYADKVEQVPQRHTETPTKKHKKKHKPEKEDKQFSSEDKLDK